MASEKREIEIALKSRAAESSADSLNKKVKGIGTSADKTEQSMFSLSKVAASVSAALVTRQIVQYADAWTNVSNRLKAATSTQEEFLRAQQGVISIAQQAGVDISGVADSYSRLAQSTAELGISQERVLAVTKNVALALKAGGATAGEVSSIAVQLGQGLGSGALQGDELRSVLESSIPIAKALAKEFNTTTGELKTLGAEGKLTAARVVSALENMDEKALTFTKDISGGFTEVSNALTVYVGNIDESLGVTETMVGSLSALAENIDLVVGAVTSLAVLFGARYAGALATARSASLAKVAANERLVSSELAILKASQSVASQDVVKATQAQALAKLQLAAAQNTKLRSVAISNLAKANGQLIVTERALTAATGTYTAAVSRATVATGAMTVASKALSASMAFIGGPVGLVIIAAAALLTFGGNSETAEEKTRRLSDEVNHLADSFANLSKNQKTTELNKTNKDMQELRATLVDMQKNVDEFELKAKSETGLYSASAVKASMLKAEMKGINDELDTLSRKQEALVGTPDLSGGVKRNFVDGVETPEQTSTSGAQSETDAKAFESLKARLELETQAIQAEAEVRRAFAEGEINQRQLDEELALQNVFFNYESRRAAILENEKLTHEQKTELIAELAQQEIDAEQIKQDQITEKTKQGSDDRTKLELLASNARIDNVRTGASATLSLLSAFGSQSSKTQKKFAIADAIINIAAGVTKALNNPYPANLGFAAQVAASGAKLLTTIKGTNPGGSGSSSFSPSSPVSAPAPASVDNQSQDRIINITGLENFGPNDMIPITREQFENYISESEGVNIAINNGQSNAQRIGAI